MILLCRASGLPEHWFERQGKIQERIEGVQRENEAHSDCATWKFFVLVGKTSQRMSWRSVLKWNSVVLTFIIHTVVDLSPALNANLNLWSINHYGNPSLTIYLFCGVHA